MRSKNKVMDRENAERVNISGDVKENSFVVEEKLDKDKDEDKDKDKGAGINSLAYAESVQAATDERRRKEVKKLIIIIIIIIIHEVKKFDHYHYHYHYPSNQIKSNILYIQTINISQSTGCLGNHNGRAAVQWHLATRTSGHREQNCKTRTSQLCFHLCDFHLFVFL